MARVRIPRKIAISLTEEAGIEPAAAVFAASGFEDRGDHQISSASGRIIGTAARGVNAPWLFVVVRSLDASLEAYYNVMREDESEANPDREDLGRSA